MVMQIQMVLLMYGTVNFTNDNNLLCLKSDTSNDEYMLENLEFCGYLTLLETGALWFAGNVTQGNYNCTAFAIKGYVNTDKLLTSFYDSNGIDNGTSNGNSGNGNGDSGKIDVEYVILIAICAMIVSFGLAIVVLTRCMGYSKGTNTNATYAIMSQDNRL